MNRKVKIGGTYQHFKGFIAKVITVAKHTETGETLVVYECNGKSVNSNHEDGIYARPIEMFLSKVDHNKYPDVKQEYRFELIEEGEEQWIEQGWNCFSTNYLNLKNAKMLMN